ncbi:MAG: hypothetical protein WCC64_15820 [Aliidongia sp.]
MTRWFARLVAAAIRTRWPLARDRSATTGDRRMIPQDNITAWSRVAPWASQRQVELVGDLLIDLESRFTDFTKH